VDFNLHVLLKAPGFHLQPGGLSLSHEAFKKPLCLLRWGRIDKTGPAPLLGISEKGKLAHQQQFPLNIKRRKVKPAPFVRKNAQVHHLAHQILSIPFAIPASHPDKTHQPPPYLPNHLTADANRGTGNPLQQYLHRLFPGRFCLTLLAVIGNIKATSLEDNRSGVQDAASLPLTLGTYSYRIIMKALFLIKTKKTLTTLILI